VPLPAALAPTFAPTVSPAQQPLTARDVVERIKHTIAPVDRATVDTFKDGDPATPVTGIAVTMMATFDVLQRAGAHGANPRDHHEPTFTITSTQLDVLESRTRFRHRRQALHSFVSGRMVVVRMNDHWHRQPSPSRWRPISRACSAGALPAQRASGSTGYPNDAGRARPDDSPPPAGADPMAGSSSGTQGFGSQRSACRPAPPASPGIRQLLQQDNVEVFGHR